MEQGIGRTRVFGETLWIVLLCVALGVCFVSLGHAQARYAAAQAEQRRVEREIRALKKEREKLLAQKKALLDGNPLFYERLGQSLLNLRRAGTVSASELENLKDKKPDGGTRAGRR